MRLALAVLICVAVTRPAWAQSGENVAVVINDNSAQSRTIGEYYAAKRDIPAVNMFRIRTSVDETIDRATFIQSIEWPLRTLISARGLQDRVLYIVLTKDVPLRIAGSTGQFWTAASVDSELTLLYRRMIGDHVPVPGHVDNPYFVRNGDVAGAKPFTHRDQDIVLVSRLDGASVDDVLALIDRAAVPAKDAVLQSLSGASIPTVPADGVPGPFAAGSVAAAGRAYRATSFRGPSPQAGPGSLTRQPRPHAVEVADLIHLGATAAAGDTRQDVPANPIHTDFLFRAYLAGANAVEAFYLAMPYLSANTVIIGDPLCAPFRERTLTRSDIEAGEDPNSALPRLFADRRIAALRVKLPYVPVSALALALRAAQCVDRGERDLARVLLEQATAIAPQFGSAQFNLGLLHQTEGNYERAMASYRLAIEALRPPARDEVREVFGQGSPIGVRVAALNNLAYLLAVHLHKPAEALPFAAKAVAEITDQPPVLDTLAWIEFLLGDTGNAATHIRMALARGGSAATIHFHAASIFAAAGARAEAETHLKEALRLQPDLNISGETAGIGAQRQLERAATTTP